MTTTETAALLSAAHVTLVTIVIRSMRQNEAAGGATWESPNLGGGVPGEIITG